MRRNDPLAILKALTRTPLTGEIVLAIPDLHCPADHRKALPWIESIAGLVNPTRIMFLGDVVDHNAISFHDKFPELPAAVSEYRLAKRRLRRWVKVFKEADVAIGNHDDRVNRLVRKIGIPASIYLKTYNEVYEIDGWRWHNSVTIDDVVYTHGWGRTTAWSIAKNTNKSTVCGHLHTEASLRWAATDKLKYFGMNCGCLIDRHHPAMEYARNDIFKPLLGCGIVINGKPILELIDL